MSKIRRFWMYLRVLPKCKLSQVGFQIRLAFCELKPNRHEDGQAAVALFFGLGLIALLVMAGMCLMSANKHLSAERVQIDVAAALPYGNDKVTVYYSAPKGTALFMVRYSENDCGAAVWRITDSNGVSIADETYECTAFADTCKYWTGVLARDAYIPVTQQSLFEMIRLYVTYPF